MGWFEENNQASENFWKTASQPKRHNASLWRLNVHESGRQREGEAGHM